MAKEYLIGDFLKRIKRPIDLEPNKNYNLVTIKMNHKGVVLRGQKKGCDIKSKMFQVKEGDFILSGIDARNGAFGIVSKELEGAIVTNDFWYFEIDEKIISKQLFLELTATTWFDDICQKGSDGTTQRIRLQKNKFFNQKIFLPEGDEQKELLNKILTFKKGQTKLNKEIDSQKNLLTKLKQSILQEAIQGKLTEGWRKQNPNTESASELLKRIKAEKAQLIKEKKIKKEKPLPTITKEEIPFELPEDWVWTNLDEIALFKNGKAHEQFVDPTGKYVLINSKFVSTNGKIAKYTAKQMMPMCKNEVAIVMSDVPNGRALSRCYMIKFDEKYSLNQRIGGIVSLTGLDQDYLIKILDRNRYYLSFNDGKKQTNLKKSQIMSCPIPLPPLSEQKEIVKKVDSLMQQCQALEQEIKTSEANAKMLMQAVLKEAFESKENKPIKM